MTDERSNDDDSPVISDPPGALSEGGPAGARAWLACVLAGIAAGLIGFGLGEAGHDAYKPAAVKRQMGNTTTVRPSPEAVRHAFVLNTSLAHAGWGAALGIALGVAGGLSTKRKGRPLTGAVVGMVAGGLAGAILPMFVLPVVFHARSEWEVDSMVAGLPALLAIWGVTAAAAALGFAIGGRRPISQTVAFAILGAIAGAVVYLVVATLLDPLAETDQPIALVWRARLLARLSPSLGAAALLATVRPAAA